VLIAVTDEVIELRCSLLQRMSLFLALFCHANRANQCLVSGGEFNRSVRRNPETADKTFAAQKHCSFLR
jgi:hypothetical protein